MDSNAAPWVAVPGVDIVWNAPLEFCLKNGWEVMPLIQMRPWRNKTALITYPLGLGVTPVYRLVQTEDAVIGGGAEYMAVVPYPMPTMIHRLLLAS